MDGLGTLRNLFCSGDCWSQFRVYLGGGFKYFFSIPIAGRFPFWLIFFKRIETTNQFWVMWSQNETKIIKTCGQPSMKQIRDSPHRPRKNEPCQPCQPWFCHRWISQPSRNEKPPVIESWSGQIQHENGDESYPLSWDSLFVWWHPKVFPDSVPKLLVLFLDVLINRSLKGSR